MSWENVLEQIGTGRRQDDKPRLDYVDAPPYYLTAYGIAVKHGFVGTEEEWLESLKADMRIEDYDPDASVGEAGGIPAYVSGAVLPLMPQLGTISVSATWTGSASPYSQTVTVTGAAVDANSKVDLQFTAAQLETLKTAGVVSMTIGNDNGTLTLYAIGAKTTTAMTVQCTVQETT